MINPSINVNGYITNAEDAVIPVLDRGFLYGDSVYEVFRTYKGVPVFMDDHFERLENSARLIHMDLQYSRETLLEEIRKTAKHARICNQHDAFIRMQITRGESDFDLFAGRSVDTRFVIIIKKLPEWNLEYYKNGMKMAITSVRRNSVNALDPNIKGGNYLNNILALTEARNLGADDCVMLDRNGLVTEAATSNIWFVINGRLVTPGSGNLKGITKKNIHKALDEAGICSYEEDVHLSDINKATECFVTSTTREVMPCISLNLGKNNILSYPAGGGDVTFKVKTIFSEYIKKYIDENAEQNLISKEYK